MSVTISTHNGTKMSREHNVRNRNVTDKEKHINPKGVFEIWHDEKIRHAYTRLFGDAVSEYNAKQKRDDRKIENYFREVCKDEKRHAAYEMIVGVYGGDVSADLKREILREFVDSWKQRNPNLELIGAYFHYDEESKDPHVHIDYIPIAHGYKKGPETQTGLNRALYEQDGFQTDNSRDTAQIKWERKENAFLESLCVSRGLDVAHPMIEDAEHLETDIYKAEKRLEELAAEISAAEKRAEDLERNVRPVRAEYEARKEYVKTFEGELLRPFDQVKKNKDILKRTKSYEVPAKVWETQRLYQSDIAAHAAAQERWEAMVKDYPEIVKKHEDLCKLVKQIDQTLETFPQDVRDEFFARFGEVQDKNLEEKEKAPETQKNELTEPEER